MVHRALGMQVGCVHLCMCVCGGGTGGALTSGLWQCGFHSSQPSRHALGGENMRLATGAAACAATNSVFDSHVGRGYGQKEVEAVTVRPRRTGYLHRRARNRIRQTAVYVSRAWPCAVGGYARREGRSGSKLHPEPRQAGQSSGAAGATGKPGKLQKCTACRTATIVERASGLVLYCYWRGLCGCCVLI